MSHSTTKLDFIALAAAGNEVEWLRNLLLGKNFWPQLMGAISLHCYSDETMSRAFNKIYNEKSRHISLRHAYIRQLISGGIITMVYVRSCNNLADPFTKALSRDMVKSTSNGMWFKPFVRITGSGNPTLSLI